MHYKDTNFHGCETYRVFKLKTPGLYPWPGQVATSEPELGGWHWLEVVVFRGSQTRIVSIDARLTNHSTTAAPNTVYLFYRVIIMLWTINFNSNRIIDFLSSLVIIFSYWSDIYFNWATKFNQYFVSLNYSPSLCKTSVIFTQTAMWSSCTVGQQ